MDLDLEAIERRANAATPGPWVADGLTGQTVRPAPTVPAHSMTGSSFSWPADAAFVAHAREDVPALIAEVRRLRAELYNWKHARTVGTAPVIGPDAAW